MCLPNKIKYNYENVIDREKIPKGGDLHELVENEKNREQNENKPISTNQTSNK